METQLIIGIIITIIMGFGWGSFATMATYRLPRGKPWIGDKPRCFLCKAELNIIDYFSVFSFFLWRGKCRHCGGEYEENISYFLTELSITAIFVLIFLKYGFSDLFVILTGFTVATVILATIDAEHKKIPAKVLISILIIAIFYRLFLDQGYFYTVLYGGILGAVFGLAVRHLYFIAIGKKEIGADYTKWQHTDRFIGPGFDYVKLMSVVGICLTLEHFIAYIILAAPILILWRLIHNRSFRIGTIMSATLLIFIVYPEIPEAVNSYFPIL